MPRASVATSRRSRRTRASSSIRWSGPTSTASTDSARRLPSNKRLPAAARVPLWALSQRSMTTCACFIPPIGVPHCPQCGRQISRQSADQIVQQVMELRPEERVMILAPDRSRPQRRVQEGAGQAGAAGLHARAHRWRAAQYCRRRDQARQAQEPHHRTGGRSASGEAGHRGPAGRFG